ncbi:hypothetical protein KKF29_02180, partial [Patescibacteria group bacterium]|nr:hypothetical protein [Patescibacteria group bacterium]
MFGSISVRNQEFCILNKQYDEASFDKLKIKIVEHMKNMGEYGQFWPIQNSPFCYNETAAQDNYPLDKKDA